MFITVRELQLHKVEFHEEFQPEAIDLGPDLRQEGRLKTNGRAELIEEHHGRKGIIQDIRLVGDLSARVELSCARCLDPVQRTVEKPFDLLYRPQGTDAGVSEISVTQAEADIGYYRGEGLLLEDVLREQVLLSVPLKVVCREECKGICQQCGGNLNEQTCDCTQQLEDPRWAALKDLKAKLNN
jgi:uncharacterized protein